jgi:4-alpha-glucanotransferase
MYKRKSGILLHPTSLPSKYGIGDFGREAYNFIDFLNKSAQSLWQVLPLNPPGYGESPYQSYSAFAGNYYLISVEKLCEKGLISQEDLNNVPAYNNKKIEFEKAYKFKDDIFKKAYSNFILKGEKEEFNEFEDENKIWLENYTLFMALKVNYNYLPWNQWKKSAASRDNKIMAAYKEKLHDKILYFKFLQYIFFEQWYELKKYANEKGIKIIGDIPIYISYDSSDVWANPELYKLDSYGNPAKVAGVPPDYFSKTGQLWGNPIYKWNKMKENDYKWWRERLRLLLKMYDIIRIDHFRGFEAYWEISGEEKTAVNGKWVKGPGSHFFSILKKYLGELPLIAEDLGIITEEVTRLRKEFNFPGMRVLQFEFEEGWQKGFSPYIKDKNTVVYTGTHDNNTILGWYNNVSNNIKRCAEKYLNLVTGLKDRDICWYFIELALRSNADIVIIPLQDLFCLGSEARMNLPGSVNGNWEWRFENSLLTEKISEKMNYLVKKNNRLSN